MSSNSKHNVLFLRGLRDDGTVQIVRIIDNNNPVYNCEGSCNIYAYLEGGPFNRHLITLDANQEQNIQLPETTDLVFNQISDADTHRVALTKAARLCDALKTKAPCLNSPGRIVGLTRDRLAHTLAGVQRLRLPETVRCTAASPVQLQDRIRQTGWGYPVIVRRCGDHNGRNMVLLTQSDDANALAWPFFRGECYLIRFIDYADPDGIYRKHRLACIDGEFHVRHVLYNDDWMVHAGTRKEFMSRNTVYQDAENEAIADFNTRLKPALESTAQQLRNATGLEYFGIDCSIDAEGTLTIFELNANMNILLNSAPLPNIWEPLILDIKQALMRMMTRRLQQA